MRIIERGPNNGNRMVEIYFPDGSTHDPEVLRKVAACIASADYAEVKDLLAPDGGPDAMEIAPDGLPDDTKSSDPRHHFSFRSLVKHVRRHRKRFGRYHED